MNRIGAFQLAVMFCACILGAGFLSGNELWQFFATFGIWGMLGCALSVIAIGVFCAFIAEIAVSKNTENPEEVLLPLRYRKLSSVFGILQAILVFAIVVIMVAGSGTLVNSMTGFNKTLFAVFFCALLCAFVLLGTENIVRAFSVLIPFVVTASVIISVILIFKSESFNIPSNSSAANPLLNNWAISAVSYASYSVFASVGVFAAISSKIRKRSVIWKGVALGILVLCVVSFSIISAIYAVPNAMNNELPMLASALHLGKLPGVIYAVLLLFGMFGAALSCFMALANYLKVKLKLTNKTNTVSVITCSVLAYFGGLFGFGDLVGTVYPIFGYIGIAVLALLMAGFIKIKKNP